MSDYHNMIEAMAKAMFEKDAEGAWDDLKPQVRQRYRNLAKPALEALEDWNSDNMRGPVYGECALCGWSR